MGFSEWVSLGDNCEAAFQIRRVLGRDSSSFFSWNVTPLPALLGLLADRFGGILHEENLSPHADGALLNDRSHNYKFHSPFTGFRADPLFATRLAEHRAKADHLAGKFLRPRGPEEATAYFYKLGEVDPQADVLGTLRRVRDLLRAIHGPSRFALVVLHGKASGPWADETAISFRPLARLAPWYDAPDGHVASWDAVFAEFAHREPMRLAGY